MDNGEVDVDELAALLRRRVEERRAAGQYPDGMEAQMEAEFAAIMDQVRSHRSGTMPLVELQDRISARGPVAHGVAPSGAKGLVVAGVDRLVAHAVRPIEAELGQVRADLVDAIAVMRQLVDVQRGADERLLNDVLGAVLDRLSALDHLSATVADLESRIERIERERSAG